MSAVKESSESLEADALAVARTLPGGHLRDIALASVWERLSGTTVPRVSLGRYQLDAVIGVGGMGQVFRAWDERLGRAVALKLVAERRQDEERMRLLLEEARAAASVRDPNVVEVYDVGTFDRVVFIAMELVPGPSLADWVRNHEPPVDHVIEACIQAGRGLAAAHRAGIVHHDFKPQNVVVELDSSGAPRRARVVDFGLARRAVASDDRATEAAPAGTLLYVAPEQLLRAPSDPSADQFSFCVAAWECIYGVHPFARASPAELLHAMNTGPRPAVPTRTAVPVRIGRALRRGLAIDPQLRFPSMDALLARLTPMRSRVWILGAATLVAAAGVVVASSEASPPAPCNDPASPMEAVWSDDRRVHIVAVFESTGIPTAGSVLDRVERDLDGFAEEWSSAFVRACALRGMAAPVEFDRARDCLSRDLHRVDAWVEQLEAADAALVESVAVRDVGLPHPADCLDPQRRDFPRSFDDAPDDPNVRAIARATEEAWAAMEAGRHEDALAAARRARAAATAARHRKGTAVALLLEARALDDHDPPASGVLARDAYHLAIAEGLEDIATAAAILIADAEADSIAHTDDALHWLRLAESSLARRPDEDVEPEIAIVRAQIQLASGAMDEAVTEIERALRLARRSRGDESPYVARLWNMLGIALSRQGHYDRSLAAFQEARSILEAAFGPMHPGTVAARNNIAGALYSNGRWADALHEWEALLPAFEEGLAAQGPNLAALWRNIGLAEYELADYEAALVAFGRALVTVRAYDADNQLVGTLLVDVAQTHAHLGDATAGLVAIDGALDLIARVVGPNSREYGSALYDRAAILVALGRHAEARQARRSSLDVMEALLGPEHPQVSPMLASVARDLVAAGRRDEALPMLERAALLEARQYGNDSPQARRIRNEIDALTNPG